MKKLLALSLVLFFGAVYPVCARDITHEKYFKTRKQVRAEAKSHKAAAAAKINYDEDSNRATLKSNYYLHGDPRGTTPSKDRANFYQKED